MVSSFLDLLFSCCEVSGGSRAAAPIERKKERKRERKKEKKKENKTDKEKERQTDREKE